MVFFTGMIGNIINGLLILVGFIFIYCALYTYEVKSNKLLFWEKKEKETALKKSDLYKLFGVLIALILILILG